MYFLDTNTCIYFLNGKYESIKNKVLATPPNEICIPSIVKAELLLGAEKSIKRKITLDILEKFLHPFSIIPFDDQMTYIYAKIRKDLEENGIIIDPNDILIATIVLFHDGILITNNEKEFKRVNNLRMENWVK